MHKIFLFNIISECTSIMSDGVYFKYFYIIYIYLLLFQNAHL